MPRRPVVLIHGYSDRGESFLGWKTALTERGYDATTISICSYESLVNELTVKDIAEGFDRALRVRTGLDGDEPFDAIVHSTGMLVIRSWLTSYDKRRGRLKHLVALAPATFGSPLAHKGRSWLGAIFKGRKDVFSPDFLEAGDLVLDALELGSKFTWDLAHLDLIGDKAYYGPSRTTPYAFVFCGSESYRGLRSLINEPGTDGTVRWAGCSLNTRKIVLDLTRDPARPNAGSRTSVAPWSNVDVPLIPVAGLNHGTIVNKPPAELVDLVTSALEVSSPTEFEQWVRGAERRGKTAREAMGEWQQFVVRAVDERGDPISDYNLQLLTTDGKKIREFDTDVHTYSGDKSLRCFHVNLAKVGAAARKTLRVRVIASSGSRLVGYHGLGSEKMPVDGTPPSVDGKWDAQIDLSPTIGDEGVQFFYPFTTTLVELQLNREPLPLSGPNAVTWWIPRE